MEKRKVVVRVPKPSAMERVIREGLTKGDLVEQLSQAVAMRKALEFCPGLMCVVDRMFEEVENGLNPLEAVLAMMAEAMMTGAGLIEGEDWMEVEREVSERELAHVEGLVKRLSEERRGEKGVQVNGPEGVN